MLPVFDDDINLRGLRKGNNVISLAVYPKDRDSHFASGPFAKHSVAFAKKMFREIFIHLRAEQDFRHRDRREIIHYERNEAKRGAKDPKRQRAGDALAKYLERTSQFFLRAETSSEDERTRLYVSRHFLRDRAAHRCADNDHIFV